MWRLSESLRKNNWKRKNLNRRKLVRQIKIQKNRRKFRKISKILVKSNKKANIQKNKQIFNKIDYGENLERLIGPNRKFRNSYVRAG